MFLGSDSTDSTVEVIDYWKTLYPNTISINFNKDRLKEPIGTYDKIALVRQLLLEEARKLNVDYAIFVDDDMFIANRNFIETITGFNKDIVGGAYYREYPSGKFLSYLDVNKRSRGSTTKRTHPYLLRNYLKLKLMKVVAVGGGCMCISNKVLMDTRVNFYPIHQYCKGVNAEDYAYCLLASKCGYKTWVYDGFNICHYQLHEARSWRINK